MATPTGIQLVDTIRERLLTSCELTGIWEKKLRDIEARQYSPEQFINELKEQVTSIVQDVLHDNSNRQIDVVEQKPAPKPADSAKSSAQPSATKRKPKSGKRKSAATATPAVKEGDACPKCGKGHVVKGKTAFGCSQWREGCDWRMPFKKL